MSVHRHSTRAGHGVRVLRRVLSRVFIVSCSLFPPSSADAQTSCSGAPSCSVTVQLSLTRNYVASLQLSSATTALPAVTADAFTTGFTPATGPALTVRSNAPYVLTIQAAQPTWSYTGSGANPAKTANDLEWSTSATGPFNGAGAVRQLWPSSGAAASATALQTISLFYQVRWSWANSPPGTYSLPVTITLTSP